MLISCGPETVWRIYEERARAISSRDKPSFSCASIGNLKSLDQTTDCVCTQDSSEELQQALTRRRLRHNVSSFYARFSYRRWRSRARTYLEAVSEPFSDKNLVRPRQWWNFATCGMRSSQSGEHLCFGGSGGKPSGGFNGCRSRATARGWHRR